MNPKQPPNPLQPEPTNPAGDVVGGDKVGGDKVLGDAHQVGAIGGQSIVVVGGGTINYYGAAQPTDPAQERTALLAARRAANAPSPYIGLQSFDEASAPLFFGREALVAQLVTRLKQTAFLAVLGPSGSGKSSVVRAGLVPALKGGALSSSDRWLYLPPLRPGPRPLDALAVALASAGNGGLGGALALRRELLADGAALRMAADMLLAADAVPGRRVLLLVDQFEELWTLAPNDPVARAAHEREQLLPFLHLLLTAATAPNTPLVLVIAMRADFLHRAAEQRALASEIERGLALISPLNQDELRRAIEQPAVRAGGRWEPGLIDALVAEAHGQPGALPLLAYALRALWETRDADETLTWASLRELGGVAGALAARADMLLHEHYTPERQGELRRVLLRLVQPGEGTLDTRRRALLRDLSAGNNETELHELLRPLVDERLLTTGHDEASGAATVEVAHEALLRAWPTFARWVGEARSDLRFHIQVEEAARDWAAHRQSFDFLWAGLRLANADEWLLRAQPLLSEREAAFLQASREAEEARLAVEVVRAREREELLQQERRARQEAEAQALAGEALFELARGNVDRAVLLACAALEHAPEVCYPPLVARALRRVWQETVPARRLYGHTSDVVALSWHPDGRRLLSGGEDGTARVWDLETNQTLQIFTGHGARINAAAWSPDGCRALTAGSDGVARLWDATTYALVRELQGHQGPIMDAQWSPDGACIATGSDDATVRVWDAQSGAELHVLRGHTARVNAVAWRSDGRYLASGGNDCMLRVWQQNAGMLLFAESAPGSAILALDWYYDTSFVGNGSIFVGRAQSELQINLCSNIHPTEGMVCGAYPPFVGHSDWVHSIAFAPNEQGVLTTSGDETARIWQYINPGTLNVQQVVRGHTGFVMAGAWSPDGKLVATAGVDRSVRIQRAKPPAAVPVLGGAKDFLAARWCNNSCIVAIDNQGALHNARLVGTVLVVADEKLSPSEAASLPRVLSHDGHWVPRVGVEGTIRLYDTETGGLQHEVGGRDARVHWLAFSADERLLVVGYRNGGIGVWELATGREVARMQHSSGLTSVACSFDGRYVLSGGRDGCVRVWEVASARLVHTLDGHNEAVRALAYSPDGRLIATGSRDGLARLWNAATGALLQVLHGHTDEIMALDWSPDGVYLASGSRDRTARVWSCDGAALQVLEGHTDWVRDVAWSPDGQRLLTASRDGTARVWLADLGLIAAELTRRATTLFPDDTIAEVVPGWQGAAEELARVAGVLRAYDELYG